MRIKSFLQLTDSKRCFAHWNRRSSYSLGPFGCGTSMPTVEQNALAADMRGGMTAATSPTHWQNLGDEYVGTRANAGGLVDKFHDHNTLMWSTCESLWRTFTQSRACAVGALLCLLSSA